MEKWVHFRGIGEPLLNPNIVEMTAKMSDVAPKHDSTSFSSRVWISTNGDLLDEALLKELIKAKVSKISVSKHDEEVTARCEELLKKYQVDYYIQDQFDDDWAGQLEDWECTSGPCTCAHIETGGAMVIHNGDIITCCIDGQGDPVLGSVYDGEIRHIEIAPIPLCINCRSNYYWKWQKFNEYSRTLSTEQKEKAFAHWVRQSQPEQEQHGV